MYEKSYKIKIYDSNRIISIKGKEVRTPTEAIVTESDLKIIKASLLASGCKNFVSENIDEPFLTTFPEVYNQKVIAPLEKKVVPTYDEVKARISNGKILRSKVKHTKAIDSPLLRKEKTNISSTKTLFYIPLELQSNKKEVIQEPIIKEDFEVKIEFLKVESNNVLKKLLREKTT